MSRAPSLLSGQNLWLRLLILVLAFVGAVDATLRQVLAMTVLFLLFLLLDLSAFGQIWKALRISLPFFAAYWVFATLFATSFTTALLFTLKLLLFIVVTVYVFGNLSLRRVLQDTQRLRRYRWGEQLLRFILATGLFIRAYAKYFKRVQIKTDNSIGAILDKMIAAGRQVAESSDVIEAQLNKTMQAQDEVAPGSSANIVSLCLLTCLILVLAL